MSPTTELGLPRQFIIKFELFNYNLFFLFKNLYQLRLISFHFLPSKIDCCGQNKWCVRFYERKCMKQNNYNVLKVQIDNCNLTKLS